MSPVLDRLPALVTTGVGSLPFAKPAGAVQHALGAYGLPFCPQLPRLDGDMVSEWLGAAATQPAAMPAGPAASSEPTGSSTPQAAPR
jgi:hypothetical protein